MSAHNIAFLDMLTTRFGKLQDILGSKIFPLILELVQEDALTFIDKLNKLEKIGYIDDANWWCESRKIRNKFTHDYLENYAVLAANFNDVLLNAEQLLECWNQLKEKIAHLHQ